VRPGQGRDTTVPAGELGEKATPGRIGQGGESAIESSIGIFNHLVKYARGRSPAQHKISGPFCAAFPIALPRPARYSLTMDIQNAGASPASPDIVVRGTSLDFLQDVTTGRHHLRSDEPVASGGQDAAPGPYDYLLVALGVCTSMTVGLFARRKKWPLQNIVVSLWHSRIHAQDCADCETKEGMLDRINLSIELTGPLTREQHAKLIEISEKCPVHRTLKSEINIRLQPR
jgi:uncharacterized OsmC-like protein